VRIFTESSKIAVESKKPETAQARFELAIEVYYQIVALRPDTEIERKTTNAMRTLNDEFPSIVCMNEALGICDKASKIKSVRTQLKYLRKAQEILERGLARQNIGHTNLTSIYAQVVGYVRQAEAIIEKQGKNANQRNTNCGPDLKSDTSPAESVASTQTIPLPSEFKCSCPNCTQHILVPLSLAGTAATCPTCSHEFTIPQPTETKFYSI